MNWTCLVYGTPMLGVLIWWVVSAKKWFKGPKVNVEHMMLHAEASAIEGQEVPGVYETDSGNEIGHGPKGKEMN